ncbi:centrosomal protein of 128 kDa isoform X2 [Nelusetta ayraudi]|uniref:centrosomal protein of 128 kDa isoform X2 n=1 Tax=Nelusetta ayraudi TaxID=303726 RepID=UPI003F719F6F
MNTSSGSESYDRTGRAHRPRGRDAHHRSRGRASGSADGGQDGDISDKISTLASTLKDTSRNLSKVDQMLGEYRDHTDDQAQAMTLLRESLEESISQLQSQRLSRSNGARSASASTSPLHTSDLDACSGSDGQRFYPTSPLRDYTDTARRRTRRRSHSACVRFKDARATEEDTHTVHQSLRDLRCDQQRLSQDLDKEILRRNRSDVDTRRAMENLLGHMTTSKTQSSVSSQVEQRLEELEREIRMEGRSEAGERRAEHRAAAAADERQESAARRRVRDHERGEDVTARLLKAESERSKVDRELERARRLLEQSEDSRESLVQQVEGLRSELLRTTHEKTELQRTRLEAFQPSAPPHGNHIDGQEGGSGRRAPDSVSLEREVAELRSQLRAATVRNETQELQKALERKEKERAQLGLQVEELSSDLARRETQQLCLLEQLRDVQSRGQTEKKEAEALLQESVRTRDELKTRAQEAVRQWRAKCRRLQKELQDARADASFHADKASQAAREKQSAQAQLKALSQQSEAARRELADVLGRLAQREDELHRKDVELSESRQRHLSLEQEARELKEASAALEEKTQHQAAVQARLEEENQRLEERANSHNRQRHRDQDAQAELQAALRKMTSSSDELSKQLAEAERSHRELQKGSAEMQAKLAVAREEKAALGQQLQLEREVHQKEVLSLKAAVEDGRTKKEREVQETLKLCRRERDEIHAHLSEADAASDKELCEALRVKLDRMKSECDKLATQLSTREETHALLLRKYQLLKQELHDGVRAAERRRASESELVKLEEKVLHMEAGQEAVFTSVGEELDAACRSLAGDGHDKLEAISQKPGLAKDPHRWLAETKTKVRWLCQEVQENGRREQRLRRQHQQTRDQLKALRQSRDSEHAALTQRLDQQEKLLQSLSAEKRELLDRSRRKEEEMRSLQDHVFDLETNTKAALDHLEAIPEKQGLMENFRDLEQSQRERERVEERYIKHREIIWDLQWQLDESKRKVQEYRDEKLDATSRSRRLAALSSSIKGRGSPTSDASSPRKHLTTSDLGDSTVTKPLPDCLSHK